MGHDGGLEVARPETVTLSLREREEIAFLEGKRQQVETKIYNMTNGTVTGHDFRRHCPLVKQTTP